MATPAGWYPDSERAGQLRYWDGSTWTEHRAPDPASGPEPTAEIPVGQKSVPPPPPYQPPAGAPGPAYGSHEAGASPSGTQGKPWWRRTWVVAAAALLLGGAVANSLSGDGDGDDQEPAAAVSQPVETVTETAEATETVTPEPEPEPEPTPEPKAQKPAKRERAARAGSASGFTMPNEVGNTLQGAQDHLQAVSGNPFYVSFSEDATGQARFQVLDSGWQVCSQDPAPGTRVGVRDEVWFDVVKVSEPCP